MSKRPPLTPEDRALFRASVGDCAPMNDDRIPLRPAPPPPRRRRQAPVETPPTGLPLSMSAPTIDDGDHDPVQYLRPGARPDTLRRLRRRQYPIEASLDLHGLTVAAARETLEQFLACGRQQEWRAVRIVHGKGLRSTGQRPVLKPQVGHWLRHHPQVLAFCSARPLDGGTGALYVLLRRG